MTTLPTRPSLPSRRSGTEVGERYDWIDGGGGEWMAADMETRHVFYTIRLIWNHSVPDYARTPSPHRLYRFGPRHTPRLMARAVAILLEELGRRDDVEESWLEDLAWMRGWIDRTDGEEVVFLQHVRALPAPRTDDA